MEQALERIAATPDIGIAYGTGRRGGIVRRVLLSRTERHVYYAVTSSEIVVLSVWGAQRRRGPKL